MKKTIFDLLDRKGTLPVSMLTAYDYNTARAIDEAGIDMILVGDSLGNVMLGYENTLAVTVDDMIHHGKAVCRGAKEAFVVIDMPFMSYQASVEDAVRNAGRIIKETDCQAVKLEGGVEYADRIRAIVAAGIPVVAHIGLTPQSVNALGGYKVQGKSLEQAHKLLEDAKAVEEAGAFAITLECVPDIPKFVKKYADVHSVMLEAFRQYKQDCEQRSFPEVSQTYKIADEVIETLTKEQHQIRTYNHESSKDRKGGKRDCSRLAQGRTDGRTGAHDGIPA